MTTTSRHVAIGPEFFSKAKQDYANWTWALAREFMQNSIDCGSTRIDVVVKDGVGGLSVTVTNNGASMTEETITGKLLSLGSSGKDFAGTVGGFGKAKELLYFTHINYQITSGTCKVAGSGAEYTLSHLSEPFAGTSSTITVKGTTADNLRGQFIRFTELSSYRGTITVDGVEVTGRMRPLTTRRDLNWCKVKTNSSYPNTMIVRIGGMPMFVRRIDYKRCVVVDVERDSGSVFTSNRDWLKADCGDELNAFIDELTIDKTSALRNTTPTYTRFPGKQFKITANGTAAKALHAGYETVPVPASVADEDDTVVGPSLVSDPHLPSTQRDAILREAAAAFEFDFIVKNSTGMDVPEYYLPGKDYSTYSNRVMTVWIRCLLTLHDLFNREGQFAVGWVFSEESEAEHDRATEFGTLFLVNPAVVVTQKSSRSRSFRRRFRTNSAGKHAILALAVHEFVHSLGFSAHDEAYSSKLTDVMGVVTANLRRFGWCFRG